MRQLCLSPEHKALHILGYVPKSLHFKSNNRLNEDLPSNLFFVRYNNVFVMKKKNEENHTECDNYHKYISVYYHKYVKIYCKCNLPS